MATFVPARLFPSASLRSSLEAHGKPAVGTGRAANCCTRARASSFRTVAAVYQYQSAPTSSFRAGGGVYQWQSERASSFGAGGGIYQYQSARASFSGAGAAVYQYQSSRASLVRRGPAVYQWHSTLRLHDGFKSLQDFGRLGRWCSRSGGGYRVRARGTVAMAKLTVEKWDEGTLGPLTEDAMRRKLISEGYSVSRYVFYPGTVFDYHDHGMSKKDSIVTGRFLFRMDGQDVILEAGDMIDVPAGKLHYAEVVGSQPVVFFDASKY